MSAFQELQKYNLPLSFSTVDFELYPVRLERIKGSVDFFLPE